MPDVRFACLRETLRQAGHSLPVQSGGRHPEGIKIHTLQWNAILRFVFAESLFRDSAIDLIAHQV